MIYGISLQLFQKSGEMQATLTWQLSSKYLQFAYEDGDLDGNLENVLGEENMNAQLKKNQDVENQSGGYTDQSYEISRQNIDFRQKSEDMEMLQIITESKLLLDEVSGACVFTRKQQLPKMTVSLLGQAKSEQEAQRKLQKKYVELHICEKNRHTQYQKYRINKKGILGKTRLRISKEKPVVFQNIKFNYSSEKAARLIVVLYQVNNEGLRKYKNVMVSNEINVLNQHKIMVIDSVNTIKGYFDEEHQHIYMPQNKNSMHNKISTQISREKISDEIRYFETYLTKKSKKNTNLLYIVNKYSDILDLYHLAGPNNQEKQERFKQLWKEVSDSIKIGFKGDTEKTCNYLHPEAKFVLKINSPLPSVKIIIRKEFTKLLSIIASENQFDCCEGKWVKLQSSSPQHKGQSLSSKVEPSITKVNMNSIAQPQSQNPVVHYNSASGTQKKNQGKNEDEQFHDDESDDDEDDDGEYEGQQSDNDSVSHAKRRGRRIGQRKNQSNDYKRNSHTNIRQNNKYATRNRTKVTDEDQTHNKKLVIQKKTQEKQAINLRQNSSQQSNLPFKILTPSQANQLPKNSNGSGQDPTKMMMNMGGMIFPMMNPNGMSMAMKKPDDKSNPGAGMPPGLFYLGMPKTMSMPFMMPMGANPQMFQSMGSASGGMPGNVQMIPFGNGMQAVVVPIQVDKPQQGMNGMNPMMGGFPMMFANPNANNSGNSTNNSNSNSSQNPMGMPQGFMMPFPGMSGMQGMPGMQENKGNMMGQNKQQEQNKSKPSMGSQTEAKKDEKKPESFPPSGSVDMSKFGYMGQMPNFSGMPGMQGMGMQMPQMMPGSMSGQGMPLGNNMFTMQGMNPMMGMLQKPDNSQMKGQNKGMQMPMMMQGPGGFPFLMMSGNQMNPDQSQTGQSQGMGNMGMMSFPGFMPNMQQQTSSSSGQQPPSGMPQGMMMPMSNEAMQQMMRNMNPQQQQQMMMQMKGMIPGMFQMPKNDGNDQNKK